MQCLHLRQKKEKVREKKEDVHEDGRMIVGENRLLMMLQQQEGIIMLEEQ